MARTGVTIEQVAAVADALLGEGREPSVRDIRERLRTGSPNTIHKHLTAWRARRPTAAAVPHELPTSVVREIQQELLRVAAEARSESGERLAQALSEAAELASAGEELERERDALQEQAAALTSKCDTLTGKAAEQSTELERVGRELERERRAAEEARIEVAQTRLSLEAQRQQLDALRGELEQLRGELKREHEARTAAERDQAALGAAKSGLLERLAETQVREKAAAAEALELRARVEALVVSERDLARVSGELTAVREALARATHEREQLALENARLTGQLGHAKKPEGKKP